MSIWYHTINFKKNIIKISYNMYQIYLIKFLPEHRVIPTNKDATHAVAPLLSLKTSKNSVYRTPNE